MQKVIQANIDRFKLLLKIKTDPAKLATIIRLLAGGGEVAEAVGKASAGFLIWQLLSRLGQCVDLISMRHFVEASASKVFDCVATGVRDVVRTAAQCAAEQS